MPTATKPKPTPKAPSITPPKINPDIDTLRQIAAAKRLLEIKDATASFEGWCRHALKPLGQEPARHHLKIIEELELVAARKTPGLIIQAPAGSAKSTYTSVLFPAYFALKNPNSSIIGASNTIRLATRFSRQVRNLIEEKRLTLDFTIDENQSAVEQWKTSRSNNVDYISVGVGGSILGVRADLFLIDDPYASRADAQSPNTRNAIFEWYKADVSSRLRPGGSIVIIMTRQHEDDLCGRLLQHEPGFWKVLRLPAIADSEDDPLGRKIGELLWPEYHTRRFLDQRRRTVGESEWATQFQQTPMPASGNLFDTNAISVVDAAPSAIIRRVRAWDLASTQDGDWSVGLRMARLADGRYLVEDIARFRANPAVVEETVKAIASQDGREVMIRLNIDPGSAGVSHNSYLVRSLAGYQIKSARESGSKEVRAMPAASQASSGNVLLLRGHWNSAFLSEMQMFPSARFDDQIDALSSAFAELVDVPKPMRQLLLPWMSR